MSERTVRFYVKSGLVPKPEKEPFSGADARVRYYPYDTVLRIRKIREWQQAGYSLAQIQAFGDSGPRPRTDPRADSRQSQGDWRRLVARRFLRGWYGQRRRMIEAEFVARVQYEDSELILEEAGQERLRAELGLLMEPEAARSLVDYAFAEMSDKERRVWRSRFRRWRPDPTPVEVDRRWDAEELLAPFRRLIGDLLMGTASSETVAETLGQVRERLMAVKEELVALELPLVPVLESIINQIDDTLSQIVEDVSGSWAPSLMLSHLDRLGRTLKLLGPYRELLEHHLTLSSE